MAVIDGCLRLAHHQVAVGVDGAGHGPQVDYHHATVSGVGLRIGWRKAGMRIVLVAPAGVLLSSG